MGELQTTETGTNAAIDTAADVRFSTDGDPVHVTGPLDLMNKIAASPYAQYQYAKKWVSYAYERAGDPLDSCTVQDLTTKITGGGYTVLNLITDLTQTESFRVRALEVAK
jgi:hypothetical protein